MLALDTNVLARYYVAEEGESRETHRQRAAARRAIEGDDTFFAAKTVLLELEWVLRGAYGFGHRDILRVFEHVLSLPNIQIEDRPTVESALAGLRAGLDFADALHHASSRACRGFLTFDARRFARRARRIALTPPVRILQ